MGKTTGGKVLKGRLRPCFLTHCLKGLSISQVGGLSYVFRCRSLQFTFEDHIGHTHLETSMLNFKLKRWDEITKGRGEYRRAIYIKLR